MSFASESATAPDENIRFEDGNLFIRPFLVKLQDAKKFVPFPLFPEAWIFGKKVPAVYLAGWFDHSGKKGKSWGCIGYAVWSAYGKRKGFFIVRTAIGNWGLAGSALELWGLHTERFLVRKPRKALFQEINALRGEPCRMRFIAGSILPFVTVNASIPFLTVINRRVHHYDAQLGGVARLAATRNWSTNVDLFPNPILPISAGIEVRKVKVTSAAPMDIDLKSAGYGESRLIVAPARSS